MSDLGFCRLYRFHAPEPTPILPEGCKLISVPARFEELRLPIVARGEGHVVVQHPNGTFEAVARSLPCA